MSGKSSDINICYFEMKKQRCGISPNTKNVMVFAVMKTLCNKDICTEYCARYMNGVAYLQW